MDTRTKIVPTQQAADIAASGATIVSGYFDPLLPWHASRLEEIKRDGAPLLALVAAPQKPILPAGARAELLAGLRAVDYVCETSDGIVPHFRLEEEDARKLDELIERVHARNASPSAQRTMQPGAARSEQRSRAPDPALGAGR